MWNKIYLEKTISDHPRALDILSKFKIGPTLIDRYDEIWGQSKKPYLQKRDKLNLFLARKNGQLIKEAPEAYGQSGEPHYYFIHAYNCIYECQYCYLQGYFNTPDIVLFINHEDIVEEMKKILIQYPDKKVWFHAGEFSDSLALTHLTGELEIYHDFCACHPNAIIELRTKSVNTKVLEKLSPLPNLIVSFSLSPDKLAKKIDLKTPTVEARLKAMKHLLGLGFKIAAHFDPMIYVQTFEKDYQDLLKQMEDINPHLVYLSLGVVRFTKDVHREVERNYPDSLIHSTPMIKSFDNKVRYHRPMRMWMMNKIKELAIQSGIRPEVIYLCMEENA